MVQAGHATDAVIQSLVPHLEAGDIVVDGGNAHYEDTRRREAELRGHDLHFVGAGISGGAAVWAALRVAARPENSGKTVVVIIPDFGERYVSTMLYEDLLD